MIGDAVNIASRLESEAPVGAVAIGAATMRRLPEAAVRPLGELRVKDKLDAVEAFISSTPEPPGAGRLAAMGRSSGSLLLVAAVIVVAAGCGGDDEQDDVRAQVDAFRSALVDGDGAAACDLMTTEAQDVYANIGKSGTCEGGFEQVTKALDPRDYESEIETDDVSIDGDRATVSPGGGEAPIALVKSGDEWLIDAPGS